MQSLSNYCQSFSLKTTSNNLAQNNPIKLIFKQITDKQITKILCEIQARQHQLKNYRQILQKKEQFQKKQYPSIYQQVIQTIIDPKYLNQNKQIWNFSNKNQDQNFLCKGCYQQLFNQRTQCNVCKQYICASCLYRTRQFKNNNLINYCQTCDAQYIKSTINRNFLRNFQIYKKAFQTLIKQQQSLQILIKSEKVKIKSQSLIKSQYQQQANNKLTILKNDQKISQLKSIKQCLLQKIHETNKKIQWGQSMTKNLRVKYKKLRKIAKQSFGSSVNNQQNDYNPFHQFERPSAQSQIQFDIQNLNESMITSMLQKNDQDQQQKQAASVSKFKCECIIF